MVNPRRRYSIVDQFLMCLQSLSEPHSSVRPSGHPGADVPEAPLDHFARRKVASLMRVNHAGEVSAQALYHGQALAARQPNVREHLLTAASEERMHLEWCASRLHELGDRPSLLSPFWYTGSFAIGSLAGLVGDRFSLGFVEETERQVGQHLRGHMDRLPVQDLRTRKILEAMEHDETRHGREAHDAGGRPLPPPVRTLMWAVSGVMKFGAARF